MLRGITRGHLTQQSRPLLRFSACEADSVSRISGCSFPMRWHPEAEPLIVLGAIAGR